MQRKTLTKFRCFFKELPGGLEFCIANTLREALLCTTLDKPILFLNLHDFQNFPSDSLELLFKTCWTCFSSVQFISVAQSWPTPRIAVHQASLSITISWSSLRLTSIESVMPSSLWCHPAISSSVVPFSSCPQSLPASESFPMSQLFAWGGQSTGASALASFLPKKSQDWSPSEWTGWISLQSKGLSRVFSNTTVQKHQFFGAQLSSQSNSCTHTWPLEKP